MTLVEFQIPKKINIKLRHLFDRTPSKKSQKNLHPTLEKKSWEERRNGTNETRLTRASRRRPLLTINPSLKKRRRKKRDFPLGRK